MGNVTWRSAKRAKEFICANAAISHFVRICDIHGRCSERPVSKQAKLTPFNVRFREKPLRCRDRMNISRRAEIAKRLSADLEMGAFDR